MSKQKLPFMKFFPGDYIRDTRGLSADAKGVWMDALCFMWDAPERGVLRNTPDGFARMFGITVDAFDAVLMQFDVNIICDIIRDNNGIVTLESRRMIKDEGTRVNNRIRQDRKRKSDTIKTTESRECHANVTPHISEVRSQKSEVPPKSPKGEEVPSGFASFWKAYPRKVAKKAALRAWIRYRCEPLAEQIVRSVKTHCASEDWKKDGGQFIPHPTTYLNQGRWEDELLANPEQQRAPRPSGFSGT